MNNFAFDPVNGFKDDTVYTNPTSETDTREQLFSLHEQTRDFINNTLIPAIDVAGAVVSSDITNIKTNALSEFFFSTDGGDTYTVVAGGGGGTGDMLRSVYDTDADGVVDNAELANGHTVLSDVPANLSTTLSTLNSKCTPTITTMTLDHNSWLNGVYSFENSYPVATYRLDIEVNGDTVTDAQLSAWSEAKILGSATLNSIYAKGTQPSVDIPVILTVWTL